MKPWQLGDGDNTVATEQLRMEFIFDSINRQLAAIGVTDQTTFDVFANYIGYTTGGTPSYQDMQVAWTPTNVKFGERIGFQHHTTVPPLGLDTLTWTGSTLTEGFQIENDSQLTSISGPSLVSINPTNVGSLYGIALYNCSALTTIDFPSLTFLGQSGIDLETDVVLSVVNLPVLISSKAGIYIDSVPSLVNFSLPAYVPDNGDEQIITGAALSVASVDGFLARLVANAGYVSGNVDLSGGTSAAPSSTAPGSDYAILVARGCSVTVNP